MIKPEWITAFSTFFGALAIIYVAADKRNNLPRLKFDFEQGEHYFDGTKGKEKIELSKSGKIRNLSLSKETISSIGIVVWDKKYKLFTMFDLHSEIDVTDTNGNKYEPPFNLNPRETNQVTIHAVVKAIESSLTKKLATSNFTPSIDMILCFETTDGSWFDEKGRFLDIDSADWRWRKRLAKLEFKNLTSILKPLYWRLSWLLIKSRITYGKRKIKRKIGLL